MKKTVDLETLTIEETLDHLIENAELLRQIKNNPNLEHEVAFLDSIQDSLLSHLIDLDGHQKRPLKRHHEKVRALENLDQRLCHANLDKIAPRKNDNRHLRLRRLKKSS